MDTIQNIDKIEKLLIKLRKIYTLTPLKKEQKLVRNILYSLESNLVFFDNDGKFIKLKN
jgi:hypothetical protein